MIPLSTTSSSAKAASLRVILFEGVGSRPIPSELRTELTIALLQRGYPVSVVRAGSPRAGSPRSDAGTSAIVALGSFLDKVPDSANAGEVRFRDIEGQSSEEILAFVDSFREERQFPKPGTWKPWFPVIDYDRCTNCMQCLSFCLFDVYGVDADKKIEVRNQDKCKTDCPACSRVCPEVAILFPKYRHGPINGDVVSADDLRRESMKVDISALLGGDIYQALRDRSAKAKSRFSKERDEERALKERQKCLVQLGEKLDIPPEVLASLPSFEQIREKADKAATRT